MGRGIPVLGYDIDPKGDRIVVNEDEAVRVRALIDLYLEKESLLATTMELRRRNWTAKVWITRKGNPRGGAVFEKNTLSYSLTNEVYRGKVEYRGTVYPGEHEAIVDEVVWQRVQRFLRRNGRSGGRASRNRHGALLRGLLYCAPCDAAMTHNWTKKGTRQYRYYVCGRAQKQGWDTCPTKSLPAGEIEKFVVDQLRRMGTDAEFGAEVLERARVVVRGRAHQLAQERHGLEASQRRRMAEVRRLLGSARGGTVATTRLADLQEQITVGGQRLAEIHAREAALERDRVDEDDPTAALRSFDPIWDSLWPREQARVVHLVVERVAYDAAEETVAVTFRPGGVKVLAQEVG